jgi:chemotaxis protein CheD
MKRASTFELATEVPASNISMEATRRKHQGMVLTSLQENARKKIYLHPGQFHVTTESCVVTTILGSCVAVCLCDRHTQIGGINHFLLPISNGHEPSSRRFGDVAVTDLIAKVIALGADPKRLEAKLFGGANVIAAFRDRENHLGTQNVRIARVVLESVGVPIVNEDVGGQRGRKLIFQTDDGAAWIKEL